MGVGRGDWKQAVVCCSKSVWLECVGRVVEGGGEGRRGGGRLKSGGGWERQSWCGEVRNKDACECS